MIRNSDILRNIYEYDNTYYICYNKCLKDLEYIIDNYNKIYFIYQLVLDSDKKFFNNFHEMFHKYFFINLYKFFNKNNYKNKCHSSN